MKTVIISSLIVIIVAVIIFVILRPGKVELPELGGAALDKTIEFDGRQRCYTCYLPADLPDAPPLVMALHQSGSKGKKFRELLKYRLDQLADQHKFIIVFPDALKGKWNDCRKTKEKEKADFAVDDSGFIIKVIDHFTDEYNADPSKVYMFGMSNGGHMCLRVAMEYPDKLRAMAPLLTQLPEKSMSECSGTTPPMPVMLLHGSNDPISPFEGGEVSALFGLIKFGHVESVEKTLQSILALNNVDMIPEISKIRGREVIWAEKRVWLGQGKDKTFSHVRQYIIHGGGHTLPGTNALPRFIFGNTSNNLVIVDEVIDFFITTQAVGSG